MLLPIGSATHQLYEQLHRKKSSDPETAALELEFLRLHSPPPLAPAREQAISERESPEIKTTTVAAGILNKLQ